MNEIERALSEAMADRANRIRPAAGSILDVRARARRRTRRRAMAGAGGVLALGAIGAVALASGSDDSTRFAESGAGGVGSGGDFEGGVDGVPGGGLWRCTGPLTAESSAALDHAELLELNGIVTTVVTPDDAGSVTVPPDGVYLMSACEFVPDVAASTTSTVAVPGTSTTVEPAGTSTTVDQAAVGSTTIVMSDAYSTTTVPGELTSTTIVMVDDSTTTSIDGGPVTTTVP